MQIHWNNNRPEFAKLYRTFEGLEAPMFYERDRVGDFDFIRQKRWRELHGELTDMEEMNRIVIIDTEDEEVHCLAVRSSVIRQVELAHEYIDLAGGFSGQIARTPTRANAVALSMYAGEVELVSYEEQIAAQLGGAFAYPESDLSDVDIRAIDRFRDSAKSLASIVTSEFRAASSLLVDPFKISARLMINFAREEQSIVGVTLRLTWGPPVLEFSLVAAEECGPARPKLLSAIDSYELLMGVKGQKAYDESLPGRTWSGG